MRALLLCAGRARRFLPLSLRYSKMTLPFLNSPIALYPLKLLEALGVKSLIVNTHHLPHQVKQLIQTNSQKNVQIPEIHFSHEEALLEGAGTMRANRDFLKNSDSFLYLNGDSVFWGKSFFEKMKAQHEETKALATLLVTDNFPHAEAQAVFADREGRLKPFSLGGHPSLKKYFFCGMALIQSSSLDLLKKEREGFFESPLIKKNTFVFVQKNITFFELGSLEPYLSSVKKALGLLQTNPDFKKDLIKINPAFELVEKEGALLFLGKDIKGLDLVTVKNFAVIGEGVTFTKKLALDSAVISSKARVSADLSHDLLMI